MRTSSLIMSIVFVGLHTLVFAGKGDTSVGDTIKSVASKNCQKQAQRRQGVQVVSINSSPATASSRANVINLTASTIPFKTAASGFYNPQRKSKLYDASSSEQFQISRSKLENFLACPTCFYLDRKLGLTPPPGFPFSLNNAVDALQKKEFDSHRLAQTVHPLCVENNLDAVPLQHRDIETWRNSLYAGLKSNIPGTNITLQGGVDDVWQDHATGKLFVVDYKATSKKGEVSLDADWQGGYKRQVEVYQQLLRDNGHDVSDTAYFVYSNGRADLANFDNKLEFKTSLLAHEGDASWVKPAVIAAYQCLQSDKLPSDATAKRLSEICDLCRYTKLRASYVAQDQAK